MRTSLLFFFVAATACSSATTDPGLTSDGGVTVDEDGNPIPTDDAPAPLCSGVPTGFSAAPRKYSLPAPRCSTAFDALAKNGSLGYALLDLNGDRSVDLVVYDDSCSTEIGRARWDVYAGGADGFAAAPTPYALPAPRCSTSFDALAKAGSVGYAMLDLTHDGRSDLVVFRDSCDESVGKDHWDVYVGGDAGFSAAPSRYSLPTARCNTKLDALGKNGALGYTLADLSGDGRPDLVVHRDDCDETIGRARWDVYAGGADGFTAAPAAFSLPAPRCKTPFNALGGFSAVGFTLLDLTGDRRPDLVVHDDSCDESVGTKRWDVYAAGPSGFAAAPAPYALPAARCGSKFDALARNDALGFGLLDLSCDRRPELVVYDDSCDETVGGKRWDVYSGEASGFGAAPQSFALPAARCRARFNNFASGYGELGYALLTLGTDTGRPSLVVYDDACDTAVGKTHWDIYPAAQ
jgi:hypothetical protein